MADSEMLAGLRLRRLLAEDGVEMYAYDQDEFARHLYYNRPIEASLEAFRLARATTAEILDRMGEAEWARAGKGAFGGDWGPFTAENWLVVLVEHGHAHAAQIRRAIANAG
jgi:hypothetical protein